RGIEDLRLHPEPALKRRGLPEGRAHGCAGPDQRAGADEAGLACHRLVEALEDAEGARHHLRRLRRRIELADDAHGAARPARPDEAALQHHYVTEAEA